MFLVTSCSPLDVEWEKRDLEIFRTACMFSRSSGAGCGAGECEGRNHEFEVRTYKEALELKKKLDRIPRVVASVREA